MVILDSSFVSFNLRTKKRDNRRLKVTQNRINRTVDQSLAKRPKLETTGLPCDPYFFNDACEQALGVAISGSCLNTAWSRVRKAQWKWINPFSLSRVSREIESDFGQSAVNTGRRGLFLRDCVHICVHSMCTRDKARRASKPRKFSSFVIWEN